MNPERLHQIQAIYCDTLTLAPADRKAFLDEVCGDDDDLRTEIESLLAYETKAGTCLDKPAIHFAAESLADQGAGVLVGRMLGRYQLLALVGRGGMGDVYCAVDLHLNRLVAVKILPEYFSQDPERFRRFEQEARAIAALNHPHICVLYDAGHHGAIYYLVFEYLVGELLSDRISKGALRLAEALDYAIQIAEALEHAHQQGIVHHDLKPENIMLTKKGVKLLDFGVAELRYPVWPTPSPAPPKESMAPHSASGTLAYMAPEQIERRETDARTDIFALGVIAREMLTGQRAFQRDTHKSVAASAAGDAAQAVSPADLHAISALHSVVATCLAKDPGQRWQSISEVLRLLRQIERKSRIPSFLGLY